MTKVINLEILMLVILFSKGLFLDTINLLYAIFLLESCVWDWKLSIWIPLESQKILFYTPKESVKYLFLENGVIYHPPKHNGPYFVTNGNQRKWWSWKRDRPINLKLNRSRRMKRNDRRCLGLKMHSGWFWLDEEK